MSKIKVHDEPRFSVNKLGEYLTANPSRRRRLIQDQKYPPAFITSRYKMAREAIIRFIMKGYDEAIIYDAIEEIKESTLKEEEKENSILALNETLKTDMPDLDGVKIKRYNPKKKPKLHINGLDVSVNPDLVLQKNDNIGCLKVHIIKTERNRLSEEAQKLVGTLLWKYADHYLTDDDQPPFKDYCISIDCFGNSHEIAPKSDSRRWSNIQAACEEIALIWDSV
jgi:hypothetical protein